MNTPSHHRVHHGRNPYCIDRNYGGVFIIWDKMFGTFEPERRSEPIYYGLIKPENTFDQLWLQVGQATKAVPLPGSPKAVLLQSHCAQDLEDLRGLLRISEAKLFVSKSVGLKQGRKKLALKMF